MSTTSIDPAAISPMQDRAARLYSLYGPRPGGGPRGEAFTEAETAELRRRMRADEAAAFAAPMVALDDGRLI